MLEFIVSGRIPGTEIYINIFSWLVITILFVCAYYIYRKKKWYKHVDKKIIEMFDLIEKEYKRLNKRYQFEAKIKEEAIELQIFWQDALSPQLKFLKQKLNVLVRTVLSSKFVHSLHIFFNIVTSRRHQ